MQIASAISKKSANVVGESRKMVIMLGDSLFVGRWGGGDHPAASRHPSGGGELDVATTKCGVIGSFVTGYG